jgi:hypothetical protein
MDEEMVDFDVKLDLDASWIAMKQSLKEAISFHPPFGEYFLLLEIISLCSIKEF